MNLNELKDAVKTEPIKKQIEFENLFDVVVSVAQKGQVPTLKMLKQVYEAYQVQNEKIAEGFFDILKNSLIRENGDIPTTVYLSSSATRLVEDCYFNMINNTNASQQIVKKFASGKSPDDQPTIISRI